ATIIYFHGNRGDLRRWGTIAGELTKHNYNVMVWDYPGYGKSSGHSDLKNFIPNGEEIFLQLLKYDSTEQIILYGRSLGTGLACALAKHPKVKKIILETPYTNMKSVIKYHSGFFQTFMTYDINNLEEMQNCQKPVLLLHGNNDDVIPVRMSEAISVRLKNPLSAFVLIDSGKHNNLREYKIYQEALTNFLSDDQHR